MKRINHFIKQSIIGGVLVIAPTIILFVIFRWAYQTVDGMIQPLSSALLNRSSAPELMVDLIVVLALIFICFLVGTLTSTSIGKWLHNRFDKTLAKFAPGYNLVRDIINQLIGDKSDSPFRQGEVARVKLFSPDIDTEVTAIVTSRHDNDWFTVFVPTGPNPTSGMIYHLPPAQVELLPQIKVEEALRTIIACGAGTGDLFRDKQTDEPSP
jgi:uncharacterized membrane protein